MFFHGLTFAVARSCLNPAFESGKFARKLAVHFLLMFEKGSDVKQSNIKETKYGPQCAFSVKDHVQTAHDLDMDFVFQDGLFDNSFKQLYA